MSIIHIMPGLLNIGVCQHWTENQDEQLSILALYRSSTHRLERRINKEQ
jgi:hypothetical protein